MRRNTQLISMHKGKLLADVAETDVQQSERQRVASQVRLSGNSLQHPGKAWLWNDLWSTADLVWLAGGKPTVPVSMQIARTTLDCSHTISTGLPLARVPSTQRALWILAGFCRESTCTGNWDTIWVIGPAVDFAAIKAFFAEWLSSCNVDSGRCQIHCAQLWSWPAWAFK